MTLHPDPGGPFSASVTSALKTGRFFDADRQKGGSFGGRPEPAEVFVGLAFDADGRPRTPDEMRAVLRDLSEEDVARVELAARYDWNLWARPKQLEPPGSWRWWFLLSGRGFGKSRCAAETTNRRAASGKARRIGLVGPTARLVRETMIEGPDGILARSAPWFMPHYEPSKTRLTYPNGAIATTLTADEPETLRGPSFDWMWLEEIASWRYPESFWEGAELCLRIGAAQGIITGTPKAIALVRDLVQGKKGKDAKRVPREDVVVTRGSTYENAANLSRGFLQALRDQYEGTNLGRQELYAEILEDIEGALWTYELLERDRRAHHPALLVLAVAVDPTTSQSGSGDECGIVVGGLGDDAEGYVLADRSTRGTPDHWAREAIRAFHDFRADHITYEGNFARDVVRKTIGTINPNIPLKEVTATRGKALRAEPVSALYEQGRVHHVGVFPRLEDEMTSWFPGVVSSTLERSPNRLDALVWLVTDLMLTTRTLAVLPVSTGRRESPWRN